MFKMAFLSFKRNKKCNYDERYLNDVSPPHQFEYYLYPAKQIGVVSEELYVSIRLSTVSR